MNKDTIGPETMKAIKRLNAPNYDLPGYALAMRVLQSDLYPQLDDREKAECDALIAKGQGSVSLQRKSGRRKSWQQERMINMPHPYEQGMRIVGFIVPDDPAVGLGLVSERMARIINGIDRLQTDGSNHPRFNDGTHPHAPDCARRMVSAAECTCFVAELPAPPVLERTPADRMTEKQQSHALQAIIDGAII